jgi:phage virion morphogenesis protein
MGVRGDFEELRRLREQLQAGTGSSGALKARLLKAAAAEARTQVAIGFRDGVDPTGAPWQPLKKRAGKILRKTGRLANSFTARPTDSGFVVGTNTDYATYHQQGTRRMPQRAMVPVGQLTPRWKQAIDKATTIALKNFFGKK